MSDKERLRRVLVSPLGWLGSSPAQNQSLGVREPGAALSES
jgi:hypothetical protein